MRAAAAALSLMVSGLAITCNGMAAEGSGTIHLTFARRAEIGFAPGAEAIAAVVRPEIARVATVLKADLAKAPATVVVEAYARDKAARILALQRAVDVRLALVEAGVPAERIDVRVAPSGGQADKVVIFIHRAPP